jgi:hypothetical protein
MEQANNEDEKDSEDRKVEDEEAKNIEDIKPD